VIGDACIAADVNGNCGVVFVFDGADGVYHRVGGARGCSIHAAPV